LVNGNVRKAGGKIAKQTFKPGGLPATAQERGSLLHSFRAKRAFLGLQRPYLSAPPEIARRAVYRRIERSMTLRHGYIFRS
jgi:hypothetical protein